MAQKTISIVLPCFNEEAVLPKTMARVKNLTQEITKKGFAYEVVLVDDGSRDRTKDIIKDYCRKDKNLVMVSFSRNFGHQLAALAGIDTARGDAVVLMDADLQNPPEVVMEMIDKWQKGAMVVYGVKKRILGVSVFKKVSAYLFYRFMNIFSDTPIVPAAADFRLMDRKVVTALQQMKERTKFLRGMIPWLGFRQEPIYFVCPPRAAGISKYNFKQMLALALNGIFSFSTKPLKIATYFGFFVSILAVLGIALVIWVRLATNTWVSGWAAMMVTVMFIGGVQLIVLGILGEYVGRIYNEAKGRPIYIIDEIVGGKNRNDKK